MSQLFSPALRLQIFTDHRIASILAPETAERQPQLVLAANIDAPSGDDRQQQNDSTVNAVDSGRHNRRDSSLRFSDFCDGSISGTAASPQIRSSSLMNGFGDVDQMMTVCRSASDTSCVDQPRPVRHKNSADQLTNIQPLPRSVEFQPSGLGTSSVIVANDHRVQRDDADHRTMTRVGALLRPIPIFARALAALPTDSPQLELECEDLWRQFDELMTEMVITKSGRSVCQHTAH